MGQRRELWQAAGETEQMKNATAFGLIGLGAAAIYRGARYADNKGWMQRAGLIGATIYAGATWLEPSARQSIYLQGAMSLTCLALATARYEMTQTEYASTKLEIADARQGLEKLASELRLAGRYTKHSETWWLVRGGWNKLRWANRVLDSADVALGNIEQAGPRLRDMTALLASDVAAQVNRVAKDLSELPGAIVSLKPNVANLVGADVFAPPKKEAFNDDPPATALEPDEPKAQPSGDKTAASADSPPKDPQCGSGTPAPVAPAVAAATKEVKAAAQAAAAAASAASAVVAKLEKKDAPKDEPKETKAAKAAAAAASATSAVLVAKQEAKQEEEALRRRVAKQLADERDQRHAKELHNRLTDATQQLDKHLGPVASFVQRVASARDGLDLPKGCGAAAVVRLVPDKRELVLQPGETFQFVLEGDSGKAAASYLGMSLSSEVLDIAMPLVQANSAVRLTAGSAAPKAVSTTIRISDSRREQNFDITVKVCPAASS